MILKIIGIIALIFLALVALIILIIIWKWKSVKQILASFKGTPSEITLSLDSSPEWLSDKKVQKNHKELVSLGFDSGSAYTIDEMPGVYLQSYCKEKIMTACLYKHDLAGVFIDICAYLDGGKELTITNAPQGEQIGTRPETEKIFIKDASPSHLFEKAVETIAGQKCREVSNDSFAKDFQDAYKKDIEWKAAQGGISEEEIRRIAESEGKNYNEDTIQETIKEMKLSEIRQWETQCIESFERTSSLSLKEWKRFEYNMMIFKEGFHRGAYIEYISESIDVDEDELKEFVKEDLASIDEEELLRICETNRVKLTKLGIAEKPIAATIFGVEQGGGSNDIR